MAAVDYFLKLDGIPGESKDAKHKDEIQLDSWSWGETNAGSAATGGAGAGKVSMQDFHFTAKVSKASPLLMLHCANGKHITTGLITVRKAGREQQLEFLKYTLQDVIVTSVQQAAGPARDQQIPEDAVSLNFAKIAVEYKPQNPDGTLGTAVTFQWSLSENKIF